METENINVDSLCYQYDPVEYRKSSVQKISKEVCNDILKKLYPEDNLS